MIAPQYIHNLSASFALWMDHTLLKRGFAYTNTTGVFYNYSDERLPSDYSAFGSSHKQWVTDTSVTGATIPSGAYVNGTFSGRAANLILDFENGRIITSGIATGAAITGSYSVKDFNIYSTNEDEESLITEKIAETNLQKIGTSIVTTYLPPYDQKVPALFINTQTQENFPFALGGMDESRVRIKVIVFADSPYQLDGVLGLFADTSDEIFKEIPFTSYPYTEQGDLKDGAYNYENLAAASDSYYSIDEVKSSKVTDSLKRSLQTELYIGFIDVLTSKPRYPRGNN